MYKLNKIIILFAILTMIICAGCTSNQDPKRIDLFPTGGTSLENDTTAVSSSVTQGNYQVPAFSPATSQEDNQVSTSSSSPSSILDANKKTPESTNTEIQIDDVTQTPIPKEYKTYSGQELDSAIKDYFKNKTEPLIQEYVDAMNALDQEYTPENLITAAKYNNTVSADFYQKLEAENKSNDWNKLTPNAMNYMKEHAFIPVVSMRSTDNILITAIVQPIGNEYQEFYDVMNKTRNANDEIEFLKGLNDLGYYAVDLFVDDMLNLDRNLPCNGIRFFETYSTNNDEIHDNFNQVPDDNNLKEYLEKYNRQVNIGNELINNEWNLFIFNKRSTQPAIIGVELRTYGPKVGGLGIRQKIWYGD